MMFLKKSTLLQSAIALAVVGYLPIANATPPQLNDTFYFNKSTFNSLLPNFQGLGGVLDSSGHTLNTELKTLAAGQLFDFKIDFTGFLTGYSAVETYNFALSDIGYNLVGAVLGGVSETVTHTGGAYSSFASNVITSLQPYLEITGTAVHGAASLTGHTDVVLTANTPITPVPEPEQWSLLLLGVSLVSWMVGRKQVA